ncbi:hypothetical protein [Nocardioides sp.]|uniref:hypothetical protein n=1 Tax=Nocardioides sp. TaxID=35761 RepID=UPI002BB25491|nr:hypothetical protein [Nocardioides sp.]HXH78954.1 hypothetical protein [Nocardioides sp.]
MSQPHLDEILDDIEAIEFGRTKDKVAVLQSRAQRHPVGSEARSSYLTVLGDHLQMTGRYDEARSAFEEVLESGHRSFLHPLASLLDLDLETGQLEAADRLLADLLALSRAGQLDAGDHHAIGESLEIHGRETTAQRWFTIPLRDVDPEDLDALDIGCLHGRFRVRRVLDLPLDAYDRASVEIKEIYALERD